MHGGSTVSAGLGRRRNKAHASLPAARTGVGGVQSQLTHSSYRA